MCANLSIQRCFFRSQVSDGLSLRTQHLLTLDIGGLRQEPAVQIPSQLRLANLVCSNSREDLSQHWVLRIASLVGGQQRCPGLIDTALDGVVGGDFQQINTAVNGLGLTDEGRAVCESGKMAVSGRLSS